jgi:hypothetical protein
VALQPLMFGVQDGWAQGTMTRRAPQRQGPCRRLNEFLVAPSQGTGPQVIDQRADPAQLSRGDRTQLLSLDQDDSRQVAVISELAFERSDVVLEQARAPFQHGQRLSWA